MFKFNIKIHWSPSKYKYPSALAVPQKITLKYLYSGQKRVKQSYYVNLVTEISNHSFNLKYKYSKYLKEKSQTYNFTEILDLTIWSGQDFNSVSTRFKHFNSKLKSNQTPNTSTIKIKSKSINT